MLILDGVQFEMKKNTRDSGAYIANSHRTDGTITIGFDISFQDSDFKGEQVAPSICINQHAC